MTAQTSNHFTHAEMLKRLSEYGGGSFTMTDFQNEYAYFLPGGEYEDACIAEELRGTYPVLCAGEFDQAEWEAYVATTFWDAYTHDVLLPNFPRG